MTDHGTELDEKIAAAKAAKDSAAAAYKDLQAEKKWLAKPQNQGRIAVAVLADFLASTNDVSMRNRIVQLQDEHAKRLRALDVNRLERARASKSASTDSGQDSDGDDVDDPADDEAA